MDKIQRKKKVLPRTQDLIQSALYLPILSRSKVLRGVGERREVKGRGGGSKEGTSDVNFGSGGRDRGRNMGGRGGKGEGKREGDACGVKELDENLEKKD